jgi:light-regulated signal transduction histidine kinase (bacteriophytochrome)
METGKADAQGQAQNPPSSPTNSTHPPTKHPTWHATASPQTQNQQNAANSISRLADRVRSPNRTATGFTAPTSIDVHGLPTPTPAPAFESSWSSSSDRQLGHGSEDRVYPVRSLLTVDPSRATPEHNSQRSLSLSESTTTTRPQPSRHDTEASSSRRATALTDPGQLASPTGASAADRFKQRRQNPMAGSLSSVQADADRYGSSGPLPIFEEDRASDRGSEQNAETGSIAESQGTSSIGRKTPFEPIAEELVAPRFKHVTTEDGHAVITGRDGTLQRCEDEPIHTPGAVQGFGVMIAIREEQDGAFSVRYVSENSERIIGYRPQQLFKLHSFLDILTEEQAENLLDHIDFIRDEDADPAVNGPEVFSLTVRPPKKRSIKLWTAIHINQAHPDLIICEFEADDDQDHPLRPPDELTPDAPEDTLHSNPTMEELTESTAIMSRPLRVLRSARKRRGEAEALQVFDVMSQIQEQLASAPNLESFLKVLCGIVKELTGFHRVMIYQFDASYNGKVVTELVDLAKTKDLYKGLHFPAGDIPPQARALYQINRVRLLYDRDLESARIVCKSEEELAVPLDMTHAYLRAMSPIHLKYLANMSVRASMSISINAFNELWGLIACHSYGARGMRVSFPIRKMCRLVGDTASRNIERLSYAGRLQARKLINTASSEKNPSGYIIASSDDLLKLFDADFGMLSIRGETKILGKIDQSQEALAMLEYLRLKKFSSVVTSQDIRFDFQDLRYPPGFSVIAGLLYVPLSTGGQDFIVFFRRGQVHEVRWAGNPYEKVSGESDLEPRKSFKAWHETVIGKCRDWSEEQVETAAVLCLVYGKFIEVWRQKEAALQSSKLTRLLLANSAHEFRTPLNQVINYIEIALEGSLDTETRENLARSHSASKSLIYVINDLLDLTKAEEGQELIRDEMFSLSTCLRDATNIFTKDAKRKGISFEVVEHPGLPSFVYGDQIRVRQAITNVTANALQHTDHGYVRIEVYVIEVQDQRVRIEIAIEDSGQGMSASQLDALFRDLEQVSTELDELAAPSAEEKAGTQKNRTLGLGLALVARILRNMDGQLRVNSEPGKGSRFIMQIPFEVVDKADAPDRDEVETPGSGTASVSTSVPPAHKGEVMLVDRGSSLSLRDAVVSQMDRMSTDNKSLTSLRSQNSVASKASGNSVKSDADRLIDAIQSPLAIGDPDDGNAIVQKKNSRGSLRGATQRSSTGASPTSPQKWSSRPTSIPRDGSAQGQDDWKSPLVNQLESQRHEMQQGSPPPGMAYVTDMKTPIRPVKMPDEYFDVPEEQTTAPGSGVLYELPEGSHPPPPTTAQQDFATQPSKAASESGGTRHSLDQESVKTGSAAGGVRLQVLVAEDDKINFTVLRKRLEKAGHDVFHAVNGQECATAYEEKSTSYDVVLMDMQVSPRWRLVSSFALC